MMAAVHDAQVPAVDACSYDAARLAVRGQQTGHMSAAVVQQVLAWCL